jgi:hypothetical protein
MCNPLPWSLVLIVFNHRTDLIWGHQVSQPVTLNVLHILTQPVI